MLAPLKISRRCLDADLWAEMVSRRQRTGFWWQRQPALHLGLEQHVSGHPILGPPGCSEGSGVVPTSARAYSFWRGDCRQMYPVLEHRYSLPLELHRHRCVELPHPRFRSVSLSFGTLHSRVSLYPGRTSLYFRQQSQSCDGQRPM